MRRGDDSCHVDLYGCVIDEERVMSTRAPDLKTSSATLSSAARCFSVSTLMLCFTPTYSLAWEIVAIFSVWEHNMFWQQEQMKEIYSVNYSFGPPRKSLTLSQRDWAAVLLPSPVISSVTKLIKTKYAKLSRPKIHTFVLRYSSSTTPVLNISASPHSIFVVLRNSITAW